MAGSLCLNVLWIVCTFVVAEDELRRPILTNAYVWVFVAVAAGKGGKVKNSIFWNLQWIGEFPSGIVRVFPNS